MSPEVSRVALLNLRALVVIAALVCLCVSSNVGLQFFPLPAVTSQAVLHVQPDLGNHSSHAPRAGAQSFRVPMMVQSNKRADKESPQSNPLMAVRVDGFDFPGATRSAIEIRYPVCFVTSVSMAPNPGRAPPSLT
jgi:hypothetical protein